MSLKASATEEAHDFCESQWVSNQTRSPFEARVVCDHSYITSAIFRLFGPHPFHPIYQHKYSTEGQQKWPFSEPTHQPSPYADVIYRWSLCILKVGALQKPNGSNCNVHVQYSMFRQTFIKLHFLKTISKSEIKKK